MADLVDRLRNFCVWNARHSHYEPAPVCQEAAEEIRRLRERLGPRGIEVVMIDDTGHYVNEKVKAEIERLREENRHFREATVAAMTSSPLSSNHNQGEN